MKLKVISGYEASCMDLSFLPANWDVEIMVLTPQNYVNIIANIPKDYVVINLCDGIDEDGELGECVIRELEKNKLPYTGSSVKSYKCKKSDLKVDGVKTPKYVLVKNKKYSDNMFMDLKFPVLIKPEYSSGSLGITIDSKADNIEDLLTKLQNFDFSDIVIEEFIQGREFTALICQNVDNGEPIVLEPIECIFDATNTFKHYDLKWTNYALLNYADVKDEILLENITNIAKDTYRKLGLDSYIRYDIRMDNNGEMFVVDANPYCALFYAPADYGCADVILSRSKIMTNVQFIEHNVKCAIERAKNYA
jgi:D-alanine-D-alanine ligase